MGDLRLPVRAVTADTLGETFDTVLLTAKAYDLDQAIAAIQPAVGPETAILPVLNGLGISTVSTQCSVRSASSAVSPTSPQP